MDHLPSILLELYTTVLAACVYLMRSTPYFLLYNVLFGLSEGSRNNCTHCNKKLKPKLTTLTRPVFIEILQDCFKWSDVFIQRKKSICIWFSNKHFGAFSKTIPRLEEFPAPAKCTCVSPPKILYPMMSTVKRIREASIMSPYSQAALPHHSLAHPNL